MLEKPFREEKLNYIIKNWSQIIGHFLNNKCIAHLDKSFFTNADMLEMMHRDTNANLYPMHTFLNQ